MIKPPKIRKDFVPQQIKPQLIRMDLNTQARQKTDEETVREYAEAMERGAVFPAISVFFDADTQEYILADGFHRLLAHLMAKPNDLIAVEQYLGTIAEALWFAICANQTHGLRRSNEDKRNAVEMALLHPNGVFLSNRQLAAFVGVAHTTINKIRQEMEKDGRLEIVSSRRGRDGRVYKTVNHRRIAETSYCCGDCESFADNYCDMEDEAREPTDPVCEIFCLPGPPVPDRNEGRSYICKYDPNNPPEVVHRVARRHKGDYVRVPLDRTSTDRAAAEIRMFLGENYLAALIQSAIRILKDD